MDFVYTCPLSLFIMEISFFFITNLTVVVDTVVYPFSAISSEDSIEDLAAPKTGNVIS